MINTEGCLEHIWKLLRDKSVPGLPEEYAENPLMDIDHFMKFYDTYEDTGLMILERR